MWLFGFSLLVVVCTAKCTEGDVSVEAAFQGRCGHGSPCEQLCYELHDGMYECDCTEGFELNKNGYSCQEINSTSSDDAASTSVEEDVLYQRGASFSAKLDTSDLHISMKTYDDDDGGGGGGGGGEEGTGGNAEMKPINLNSIDGQLTLRKANHNWKVAAANNKTASQPRAKEASGKSGGGATDSRSVHLELDGAGAVRIHSVDEDEGTNRGEIKALALTALEDEPSADGGFASTMPPMVSTGLPAVKNVTDSVTAAAAETVAFTEAREPCLLDCGFEGVCSNGDGGQQQQQPARCLCPYGKSGLKCEEDTRVNTPRFNQHSWLAFPALRGAYKHVQLHIEFRPESFDGILLLTGERDDLTGDFMALLLHQGFVEFWFDCGSGTGRVRSEETIVLNQWNSITIYRHRWDAWLVLNQGNRVQGRSKGLFSRITFREPVYLGGFGNITGLDKKLPVSNGFTGCIRKFVANDHDYNFQSAPAPGDVTRGFDIQECVTDRCSRYPCQHGGKCLPSDDGAICLCPLGFGGDLCEMRLDLQVPSFNGSSYLRYAPLGDSCIIWFELKIIIKPLLEDGLLLYSGHHDYGDYISLCLNMGYVEFTFDLGSGPATVRSEFPLTMGQWHTIKVSRTSRLAVLKIDQLPEVMTVSPNGFWHLSLPHSLYLGGVHNVHTLPMSLRDKGSFAGCVQKVDINDRTISIISEALGGSNVENCPHACVARPCGPLAKCVPNLDSYECQCNPQNKQCNKAEELPVEVIEASKRVTATVGTTRGQMDKVTRRYEIEEYEEEDDERTTTTTTTMVAPTTNVAANGESSDEEYYYYEYDDDSGDSGAPAVGREAVVVKESEKVVIEVERKKEVPEVTTVGDIDYGKGSSEDGESYYREEGDDSDDDEGYDDEEEDDDGNNLVEIESKKKYHKKVDKFDKKPRKFSTVNKMDAGGGVTKDAKDNGNDDDVGYNQDYDRNGDRIPYRPDLLVRKVENEQPRSRGKQIEEVQRRRPAPERDTDIDETLIEEMNRIMKNKDEGDEDSDNTADVNVDGNEGWSYGMGDEELRHAGASIGPASLDDTQQQVVEEEESKDDDDDDDDDDTNKNKPNLEKTSTPTEESLLQQEQQKIQKEKEKQVLEQEEHEDEIVRSAAAAAAAKYKGKYFRRRYQGACFTGTESYFHYSDAETMRRVISYEIDLNLRFKTHSANGLILWTGRHSALEGDDFLSLGVENGYLHLRYNLGSGEINIKYNSTKVSDGLWHRVRALRNSQEGTLKVDGGKPITRRSPGKLRQLNTDTGLYVGGLPAAPFYTRQRYTAGIVGCISELILAGELRLNFDSTILGTAHNVEPGAP